MNKITFFLLGLAAAAAVPLVLSASSSSSVAYPAAYEQALDRFPGALVDDATVERFIAHISTPGPITHAEAASYYAPRLHFSDTLLTTNERQAVVDHLSGMREQGTQWSVRVLHTLRDAADVYLIWSMQVEFRPLLAQSRSHSIGITHLRFNAAGQVVLQQDFWDSAEGFYEHMPVLGAVIRSINARFASDV